MKNKKQLLITLVVFTFALIVPLAACSAADASVRAAQPAVDTSQSAPEAMVAYGPAAVSDGLSEEEIGGLIFMREEEKLARDVYLALCEQWGLSIFQNIASSEQTHMDAVAGLLDAYGLEDPAAGKAAGEFTNPDLQALYDQLIEWGSQSLGDALKVGAAIEEIDILDLEEHLAQTGNENIRIVYENLMKGSRNHLRSFVTTLDRQTGEVYAPQYLSDEVYLSIVGTAIESGGNGNSNRP